MNHYKETIRLGVPIMLGQLGIIIVGFADNIMVGHHSTQELAAASFVNNFFNLAFIFGMGFSYGLTPIVGRLFAQKQYAEVGATLKNSLAINFIVGILLSLCMLFLLFNLDWLNQPKELYPYIIPYYILQLFSVVFTMLFNSFKQFSDGTTDTLTPMYVMLSANVVNIIGNYFLIYGHGGFPELGLTGAGISTLFSRILTLAAFCWLFCRRKKYAEYVKGFKQSVINRESIRNLVRLGLPVGFQMGVETGSFSLSVIMMGWIGSTALAAYQVGGVITTLGFMLYYGIGAAVSIRVSNFNGSRNNQEIRKAAQAGFVIINTCALLFIAFLHTYRLFIYTGRRGRKVGSSLLLAHDALSIRRRFADSFRQCLARTDRCQIHGQDGVGLSLRTRSADRLYLWLYPQLRSIGCLVRFPDQSHHIGIMLVETLPCIDKGRLR